MGTHCLIAIENKDGTVQYIYCHYDGYISYMKPMLLNEYNTREYVEELISKGGIVSLNKRDETIDNHSVAVEKLHDKWEFEREWYQYQDVYYYYLFTKEDKWIVRCKHEIQLDEI
jgi:hypothetical protein